MSAEYWLVDIVKNLCNNGLCDGEIAKRAEQKLVDNVSILAKNALFSTDQDRGKIIAVKVPSKLKMSEVADLLWYTKFSASGEYKRGIKQAATLSDIKSAKEAEQYLAEDFEEMTPDYFDAIIEEKETSFAHISEQNFMLDTNDRAMPGESQEERKTRVEASYAKKRKKKLTIILIACAVIVACVGAALTVYFVRKAQTKLESAKQYEIVEPAYRASINICETQYGVYYENHADGSKLYFYDSKTGKSKKISDALPKDFFVSGDDVYFRNAANGHICIINSKDGTVSDTGIKGALPIVCDNTVIYSSNNGIESIETSLQPDTQKTLFRASTEPYRFKIKADENGIIYFSAAPSESFHRLTPAGDGTYVHDESLNGYIIYDFDIVNGYLVFENSDGVLHLVNLGDAEGKNHIMLSNALTSAAFHIDGDVLYYTAKDGIYKVLISDIESGAKGEKVVSLDGQSGVADLYVSGDSVYCYFSNGAKKKPFNKLVLYKSGNLQDTGTVIFKVGK